MSSNTTDLKIVMSQCDVSLDVAEACLIKYNGDLVSVIMDLSQNKKVPVYIRTGSLSELARQWDRGIIKPHGFKKVEFSNDK